jgi:hypothetical protein
MPRKPRKPGFWFWVSTFTIGAFDAEKGKHRVNSKMTELYNAVGERDSRIAVLESDNRSLTKENTRLHRALHMDTVVNTRTVSWGSKSADDEVDTLSIPAVN